MGLTHWGLPALEKANVHGAQSLSFTQELCKGVNPQSDGSLAIVDINASKAFINLWVHFFVAIEDNHFDGKGVFLVSTKFKHA